MENWELKYLQAKAVDDARRISYDLNPPQERELGLLSSYGYNFSQTFERFNYYQKLEGYFKEIFFNVQKSN